MAYAAVVSLKLIINGLLNSCRVSRRREILQYAYSQTADLQHVLEIDDGDSRRSSSERLEDLDGQIRDCAHQLQDFLEFHEVCEGELEEVRKEIVSFVFKVLEMQVEYVQELSKPAHDGDETTDSSNIDFGVEMVGRSAEFTDFLKFLLQKVRPDDMCLVSFLGEVGSGRTVIAKNIFDQLRQRKGQFFDCCAWVTVGAKCELKEVLIRILAQVDNLAAGEYGMLTTVDDDKIRSHLCKVLESRRYMIVLDDVRHVQLWDYLRSSFPDQSNGSIVFVTTSSNEVALLTDFAQKFHLHRSYFEESFWHILRGAIFGLEPISAELEQAGKKIIENCRTLSLSAAKTFLFLYTTEISPEKWTMMAEDKDNPIFMVEDEILEVCNIKTEMQIYSWDMNNIMDELMVGIISNLVEHGVIVTDMKKLMHPVRYFSKMETLPILGMAGIGKSFFARKIFNDKSILCYFDYRVWVTLGPKYQAEEILIDILAQIYPSIDKRQIKGDKELARNLCVQLSSKRCLIVLDDLWSKEPLHHLKSLFPDIKGKSLVTTRLAKVAQFEVVDKFYEMKLLDKEESWCLLREKVFAQGLCPPELEKVGRKIAENCDGLPLLILTVAEKLMKVEMSEEYWNNVASGKQDSIFLDAHQEISKRLLPSYQILPEHLKPCFLYLGIFRNKYEISTSKLTNLLIAEGFLEPNPPQTIEDFIGECLFELVNRSLVMVMYKVSDIQVKTRLHSIFWHLSNSVATKNKFYHAMNSYVDCSVECMMSQRRLCIRNSILLGMRDVQNSIMSSCTSTHSLICVGPPHQYPVPISFDLRLIRVMDALTIRLYLFPTEVVELVHLRYLALTCNGDLPTSISNLWKLQHLIVSRHMSIKSSESYYSLLPVEIWDMKELKHLQIMGGCLPQPKCSDCLPNLSTLLDVSAQSCQWEVLERIPNLKRLGIRIEFGPNDDGSSFYYLNNIKHLCGLESLKCVVVNPQIISKVVPLPAPSFMFPSSLKKLSLSGFGYPWEHMSIIGKLENLQVLKLKHYAFQGPQWDMDWNSQLNALRILLIEDTNLVRWVINSAISTDIERLSFRHCYKLQELPIVLSTSKLRQIEIVDCNPLTVSWAEQMREMTSNCDVEVQLSWNDSKRHS